MLINKSIFNIIILYVIGTYFDIVDTILQKTTHKWNIY
jgi:hypothetical protein